MPDTLVCLDGNAVVTSNNAGDITGASASGFFHADVRHLTRLEVLLDGEPLQVLASRNIDYYSALVVGTLASASVGHNPRIMLRRARLLSDGAHEDIDIENHSDDGCSVQLEVRFSADFLDILEVKEDPLTGGDVDAAADGREVTLSYRCGDFRRSTRLVFSQEGDIEAERACFDVRLPPRGTWHTCIDIIPAHEDEQHPPLQRCSGFHQPNPHMPVSFAEWIDDAPTLRGPASACGTYRQSLGDLAALRFRPFADMSFSLPAGGVPWFMALFGRDSIICALQALPFQHRLAHATLEALAMLQADDFDDRADAEPGKVLHELRHGKLVALGLTPHEPYYGAHDTTPLFLVLLDEYERWTGDDRCVRSLEQAARRAAGWVLEHSGLREHGWLAYRKRSSQGIDNHCWKDSPDSMRFADGSFAQAPIAPVEVQGYAYDALRRTARLAREVWSDTGWAKDLDACADDMARRFDDAFWCARRGHYALALDHQGRQVDSMTSNTGHLLWSGIVPPERATAVVERLMASDMFTGWGLRTMSSHDAAYNPIGYHVGAVWPHDSMLVAEGMRRYRYHEEASRVAAATLAAAAQFAHRLPEAFAGIADRDVEMPVEYPTATRPQAWSAGAPLMALRTLLGMDAGADGLVTSPHVPQHLEPLALEGMVVRGVRYDARS